MRFLSRRLDSAVVVFLVAILVSPLVRAGYIDHFAARDDVGPDKAPHLGASRILVLPLIVDESDLPGESALLDEAAAFYADSQSGFGFVDYYRHASQGRFAPVVEIAPVQHLATCPFDRNAAGHCTIPRGDIQSLGPALRALRDILDGADGDVDFSRYDQNGIHTDEADGFVDGLILLSNIDFGGIALPFWRMCQSSLIAGLYCKKPAFVGELWDPTYDGVLVPWAAVSGCQGGDCAFATRVSVHEFGHLLGFADLYDESGGSTDLPYAYMGGWYYDAQPPMPSALSRYVIDWSQPRQASGDGEYPLGDAASGGDLLKLGTGDEYFLAELRRGQGYLDGSIAPAGVAIYHVDLSQRPGPEPTSYLQTIVTCVNCDTWDPMIMLEQADGRFELQQGPGWRDDAGDLFGVGDVLPAAADGAALSSSQHSLNSNRYDGSGTGIEVEVLRIDDDGALLRVAHPVLADPCADLLCPPGQRCAAGVCLGSSQDAGSQLDTGVERDAALIADAGEGDLGGRDASAADLSRVLDGARADTAPRVDDASWVDATPAARAALPQDSGPSGGCACRSAPGGGGGACVFLALLSLAWLRRRSSHRSRARP